MDQAQGYAKRHREFLSQTNPKMLEKLRASGELLSYLKGIGEQAEEMYETLSAQMQTSKNLPTEYWARVKALEAIPVTVDEIVMSELILQPIPN
jgi:hypothetical protein